MGNPDNWTTPKQIKIEREGEPRGTRRGKLKKGDRKKGRKARMDEILSAKREAERYRQWFHEDQIRMKEHPEWFHPTGNLSPYNPRYEVWFARYKEKLEKLVAKALKDGILTEETAKDYEMELYPF